MQFIRRPLSVLLAVVILLSTFTVPAFAKDDGKAEASRVAGLQIEVDENARALKLGKNTIKVDDRAGEEGLPLRQYRFTAPETGSYAIYTKDPEQRDLVGYLLDSKGRVVAIDDDGNRNLQFLMIHKMKKGETYYILPRCWTENGGEAFKVPLYIETPAKLQETASQPPISTRSLELAFTPRATDTYVFTTIDFAADTKATLYDASHKKIKSDDDGSIESNFLIEADLEKGKDYFLAYKAKNKQEGLPTTFMIVARRMKEETKKLRLFKEDPGLFAFTPERTANYTFKSAGKNFVVADVIDNYGNGIEMQMNNLEDPLDPNFDMTTLVPLSAGETYFLLAWSADKESTVAKITIQGEPSSLKDAEILLDKTSYKYTGQPICPKVAVFDMGSELTEGVDYKLSYKNNVEPGKATIIVKGIGNYTGKAKTEFVIVGSKKTSIKKADIKLSAKKFAYTGNPQMPEVSVTYKGQPLVEGLDYKLRYKNNTKIGKASVIIRGKGNFTGRLVKKFKITRRDLKDTTVVLSQGTYRANGKARKPKVYVSVEGVSMKPGKDFTVSYRNNTKAGTAEAIIKGKGRLKGRVVKPFLITDKVSFTWDKDNFNFLNDEESFVYAKNGARYTMREQIGRTYLNKLKENTSAAEWEFMQMMLNDDWGGSCYGMSALTVLGRFGMVPYKDYQKNADCAFQLKRPVDNFKLSSLITYYQVLQAKDVIQQRYMEVSERTNEENIKKIEACVRKYGICMICFEFASGGHAITAVGLEQGSWTINDQTYDRCIQINDPNNSFAYADTFNIYYDSETYDWLIPAYLYDWEVGSMFGSVFTYIDADAAAINDGGYLPMDHFTGRLNTRTLSADALVSKARKTQNGYTADSTDGIKARTNHIISGQGKGIAGYDLADSRSAYQVTQSKSSAMDLDLRYRDDLLYARSAAGRKAVFDPAGRVQIEGDPAAYEIGITSNTRTPMTWFTVKVSGIAGQASLAKTDKGYILTADKLKDVTVRANNKDMSVETTFTCDADSVLICQDGKNLCVKADTDGDGVFETVV